MRQKDAMIAALLAELAIQKDYLKGETLQSIYFGGGTPSVLEMKEIDAIFSAIYRIHKVAPDAEITLEANPDDLSPEKLRDLKQYSPVNRLSIGIQSFSDVDLQWMNRAHAARHAQACLDDALETGFEDLSIDLIYGAPTTTDEQWDENLRRAISYQIPHISCYCLTVEEGTALGAFVRKGKQPPVDEVRAARQFERLLEVSENAGYEQYEISNFALPGRYARHNTNYWRSEPYLGIGPSAHSYDGISRQWNIAHNAQYIKALSEKTVPFEREILTEEQRYNEYIMTSLRTMWGVDLEKIASFGSRFMAHFDQTAQAFLQAGTLEKEGNTIRLARSAKFLADGIAMELFVD